MIVLFQNKLYIIDFNPWGPMTDSLLFDWPDIMTLSQQVHTILCSKTVFNMNLDCRITMKSQNFVVLLHEMVSNRIVIRNMPYQEILLIYLESVM